MPKTMKATKNSKRFERSVKDIVQQELSEEIEEKHAITEYESIFLKSSIPAGVVLNGQGNYFKILPEMVQSVTGEAGKDYNTRVGNE